MGIVRTMPFLHCTTTTGKSMPEKYIVPRDNNSFNSFPLPFSPSTFSKKQGPSCPKWAARRVFKLTAAQNSHCERKKEREERKREPSPSWAWAWARRYLLEDDVVLRVCCGVFQGVVVVLSRAVSALPGNGGGGSRPGHQGVGRVLSLCDPQLNPSQASSNHLCRSYFGSAGAGRGRAGGLLNSLRNSLSYDSEPVTSQGHHRKDARMLLPTWFIIITHRPHAQKPTGGGGVRKATQNRIQRHSKGKGWSASVIKLAGIMTRFGFWQWLSTLALLAAEAMISVAAFWKELLSSNYKYDYCW